MKTIGIIGGMSFESTIEYYKIINEEINKRLCGLHSAKMFIESYDFSEIEELQTKGDWEKLANILLASAKKLEALGADYIAIATNTMHLVAPEVQKSINIPLIHIADAAASQIKAGKIDTVLLLGTKYTMTMPFYKDKLKNEYNINVITPDKSEQEVVNNIIFDELCKGIILDDSRKKLEEIILNAKKDGAKAVVLGCTELPNIIKTAPIKIIDTTYSHCIKIVEEILS